MTAALRGGALYFAGVFGLGVLLGMVRLLWLAPGLGETAAVALELPVMLAASWWWAGWLARRLGMPAAWRPRLLMGGLAFALLMAAEFALGAATGSPPPAQVAKWGTLPGGLGLAGQMAFALFPLLRIFTQAKSR